MVRLLLGSVARRIGDSPIGSGIVGGAGGLLGLQVHCRVVPVDHPGIVEVEPEERHGRDQRERARDLGPSRQAEQPRDHAQPPTFSAAWKSSA